MAGLGVTLPMLFEQRAHGAAAEQATFGRAKQVICLFLHGGHPQQETFDPKPNGPAEVRGEFGAISTNLPGVQFSEMLPRTARIAHRLAVVRSMSHNNANHVTACLPAQTGHHHPPGTPETDFPPAPTDFPPFGAVLDSIRRAPRVPTWVRIGPLMRRNNGTVLHGQTPGFLGPAHASFDVDQDLLAENVRIQAVERAAGLTEIRLSGRRDLLTEFEASKRLIDSSREARDLGVHYQRAFALLTGAGTQRAFDLAAEPAGVRERYGKTEFGQRCLLARRLAEAGVPFVNVSYCHTPVGSWDTHSQNFKLMKESLGPTFDTAFTALVEDLAERGMLDETLVFVNAEFGRTPAINKNAGRDHWPFVYSLALAGAGIQAGTIYGASDHAAAYPTDKPHDPKDMAATIYHLLGVDPEALVYDSVGRSYPLVIGKPIEGILA
ncbi:MAG TPA: DUF1501 domain-containing protein [Pirellulaceae bacterium]|jgi:hypothetical protein